MDDLYLPVAESMRQVAADAVMPRFRNLADDHIEEKASDELVTIADKESEARLSEGLAAILPEAGIVGERSEEHTSECKSLMRQPYAVFCLIQQKYKRKWMKYRNMR